MRVCLLAFTLGAAAAYHRGHHRLRQLEADPDLERDEPEKIIGDPSTGAPRCGTMWYEVV